MLASLAARLPRQAAHAAIRGYQLTFSAFVGRHCRHLPSCSEYADEAIGRHGLWAGGWMGAARICRCGPGGTSGLDLVPEALPAGCAWYKPWRYGRWRGVNAPPAIRCEAAEPDGGRSS
jgi:putative membrane protein insertion efficiency factor